MGALMARKDLLKGLMGDGDTKPDTPPARVDTAKPRYTKGAIGAVSKSIADLKNRSVIEIDPHQIDPGGFQDRMESLKADDDALMHSIKEYGQQVPVLVRPHPDVPDRYQIVYGRRRVLVLRDLGQPVKVMVRDLDDQALVMAQGQENTARKNLSFIEKANFARQMVEANYERKIICDALSIDKTVISRMLRVTDAIPLDVIEHMGSAPAVGRDRWLALAQMWSDQNHDVGTAIAMIAGSPSATDSDGRFEAAFDWLAGDKMAPPPARRKTTAVPVKTAEGRKIGAIARTKVATTITLRAKLSDGFDEWLANNISEIHRDWENRRGE